jgi:transposase
VSDGPADARSDRPPIAATTTTNTAGNYASAGSDQRSPAVSANNGTGLGRARWVVERTFAWLHKFKRPLIRYDRRHEIHAAFLALGCCLVCFRRLQNSF